MSIKETDNDLLIIPLPPLELTQSVKDPFVGVRSLVHRFWRKTMSTDLVIERDLQRLPRTWDLEEICSRIAGGEALSQISLSYGKSKQALWKYLNKEDERRKQYL